MVNQALLKTRHSSLATNRFCTTYSKLSFTSVSGNVVCVSMSAPSHYMFRIEQILGGSFVDGVLEVRMSGKESDAKEMIHKIGRMQRDLRILRKEVR
jgi:hypothetical protein